MVNRLDPTIIRREIDNLKVAYPEVMDDEESFQLALESETDLHEFLAEVVDRMAEDSARIVGLDSLLDDATNRKRRFAQRVEAYRSLAFKLLQAAELRKLELTQATLSIRSGQQRVIVTDEARLPEQFVRIKREPDKHLIASHLKAGEPVAGAELSNREESLAVRFK